MTHPHRLRAISEDSNGGDRAPHQRGQALVLFALVLAVLVLCVSAVIDVGLFIHERQLVQTAADAAALAGAQELPDDPVAAEDIAMDYIESYGLDPDTVTVSFACTSDVSSICLDGDGRYDTIRLTPQSKAPAFFGGVLSVLDIDSCWIDGCDVDATAAGCRGFCGPVGNAPVDSVFIIDRTGSMTDADLANAKNGAMSVLDYFNPALQRIGLGVLGPSSTTSTCGGSYSGGLGIPVSSGGTWLPVGMTTNYKNGDGSINNSSAIVKTIQCLQHSSVGTNLGDPVKDATAHLVANGRQDVTWGIVLFTDGAANKAPTTTVAGPPTDTGWHGCGSNSAQSGQGDGNGFQSSASSACANGGGYAADDNSGNNTNTTCSNSGKDKHRFWDFALDNDVGSGASIQGIEVRLDAWAAGSGTKRMCVELSSNGGSSWTAAKTIDLTSSEQAFYLGNGADLWGRAWSGSDFDTSSFRVRVTNVGSSTSTDFRLDYLAVKVYYTGVQTVWDGSEGPCDYAMKQADAAKALGIVVYTIGYGVEGDICDSEDPTSPWYNGLATDLLAAMATDADHAYSEPAGTDLEPVFQAIGGSITAGGSRLVE